MSDPFQPLNFTRLDADVQARNARQFFEHMQKRRSVRHFSPEPVSLDIITDCIRAAGTAPSGANRQPWRFIVVGDASIKRKIRIAVEHEERQNYESRFPSEWKQALAPLGTNHRKEYLDIAPWIIVVFKINYEHAGVNTLRGTPMHTKHYYVTESVGIATGILISALHHAGLATLTHTPNPMNFLNDILERPRSESPFVLLPVGYPSCDATVPNITRKTVEEIMLVF